MQEARPPEQWAQEGLILDQLRWLQACERKANKFLQGRGGLSRIPVRPKCTYEPMSSRLARGSRGGKHASAGLADVVFVEGPNRAKTTSQFTPNVCRRNKTSTACGVHCVLTEISRGPGCQECRNRWESFQTPLGAILR